MTQKDYELLNAVLEFNKYDLYTKDQQGLTATVEELFPYYKSLAEKFLPSEKLMW